MVVLCTGVNKEFSRDKQQNKVGILKPLQNLTQLYIHLLKMLCTLNTHYAIDFERCFPNLRSS